MAIGCKAHCPNCGAPASLTISAAGLPWGPGQVSQVLSKTVACDHLSDCPTPDLDYGTTGRWFDNEFAIAESILSGRYLRPLKVA
jgi:hypothetical protein